MQDRIPHVNEAPRRDRQMIWAFWLAAALAASAGVLPFAFGGTTSRVAVVAIPFGVAALALGALLRDAGRTITSGLYFVAGLAIVYGLLSMFSLPLQQAIGGTCPVPPQPCARGLQRPLTVSENTGMGFGAGFAIASLLVGFFGLLVFYRRTVLPPSAPPERKIPAIAPPPSAVQPVAVTPTPNSSAAENGSAPEDEPELPAHQEDERPELPPHESTPPTT